MQRGKGERKGSWEGEGKKEPYGTEWYEKRQTGGWKREETRGSREAAEMQNGR